MDAAATRASSSGAGGATVGLPLLDMLQGRDIDETMSLVSTSSQHHAGGDDGRDDQDHRHGATTENVFRSALKDSTFEGGAILERVHMLNRDLGRSLMALRTAGVDNTRGPPVTRSPKQERVATVLDKHRRAVVASRGRHSDPSKSPPQRRRASPAPRGGGAAPLPRPQSLVTKSVDHGRRSASLRERTQKSPPPHHPPPSASGKPPPSQARVRPLSSTSMYERGPVATSNVTPAVTSSSSGKPVPAAPRRTTSFAARIDPLRVAQVELMEQQKWGWSSGGGVHHSMIGRLDPAAPSGSSTILEREENVGVRQRASPRKDAAPPAGRVVSSEQEITSERSKQVDFAAELGDCREWTGDENWQWSLRFLSASY